MSGDQPERGHDACGSVWWPVRQLNEAAWTVRDCSCCADGRCRWQSMPTGLRGWGWGGSRGPFWCWPGQQCWSLSLCTGGMLTTSPTKSCSGGRPSTGRGPSSLAAARWRLLLCCETSWLPPIRKLRPDSRQSSMACSPPDAAPADAQYAETPRFARSTPFACAVTKTSVRKMCLRRSLIRCAIVADAATAAA